MLQDMMESRKVAGMLCQGMDFIHRRTANPLHPEYIPNIKIGRKRFIRLTDLETWIANRQQTTSALHQKSKGTL